MYTHTWGYLFSDQCYECFDLLVLFSIIALINCLGYGEDSHFRTSGNDLSKFIWLGNGQKFWYTNWLKGKSNNVQDKPKAMMKIE